MTTAALPPTWAMGAMGVHAIDDPHLVDGLHYRLLTDPRLGLPMRPIDVLIQRLGRFAESATAILPAYPPVRDEVAWTDSHGRILVAPFAVTADNPVTGRFPNHVLSQCAWVRVIATRGSDLDVGIFRQSARGPRLLGRRSDAPYTLGATNIDGVIVSGRGTVRGLNWLDLRRVSLSAFQSGQLALPVVNDRPRYVGLANGGELRLARERVERGAPLRLGLHDDPTVDAPISARAATPADELARLDALTPSVRPDLLAALDDLSATQAQLVRAESLTETDTTAVPEASWRPTELLHTAMHDPTIARWLGFMDVFTPGDVPIDLVTDDVVIVMMRSWWAIDPAVLTPAELFSFLVSFPGLVKATDPAVPGAPAWDESPDGLPIFELWAPAVVAYGAPAALPGSLSLGPEVAPSYPQTPDGLGPWLSSEPPDARRLVTVPVSGLDAAAGLAFAVDIDGAVVGLNERIGVAGGTVSDRALRLVPSVPADATSPDSARLTHRATPAEGATFRAAQCDLFGRWGPWSEVTVAAKARPPSPEPVFDLWYTLASAASGIGPEWGRLEARVQVPPAGDLAPGSRLLDRIRLVGDVDGAGFAVEAAVTDIGGGELVVEIPRPSTSLLGVGQVATARVTARWIDTTGVESVESRPRVRACVDRRAPEPVQAPPVLDWTARPDTTGRARVRLTWTPVGAQSRFRVFACDEDRLLTKATEARDGGDNRFAALLSEHADATDKPSRAQVLRDHHALFERDWFENLTDDPVVADGTSALSYQHDVSGSLGVLAMYKVVAETGAGAGADFSASPLWVWAVPERSGPPRPFLEVLTTSDGPPRAATLRVRLTGDPSAATRYRLRRSVLHSNPKRMPVAAEGAIALALDAKTFDIVDTGAFLHDPDYELQSGARYSWAVEVQSPDLPGSTRAGAWSQPSPSVSRSFLPPPTEEAASP